MFFTFYALILLSSTTVFSSSLALNCLVFVHLSPLFAPSLSPSLFLFILHTSLKFLGRGLASQPTERKNYCPPKCSAMSLSTLTQKSSRWSGPIWKVFSQLFPASHDTKNTYMPCAYSFMLLSHVCYEARVLFFKQMSRSQQQPGLTLPTRICLTPSLKKKASGGHKAECSHCKQHHEQVSRSPFTCSWWMNRAMCGWLTSDE